MSALSSSFKVAVREAARQFGTVDLKEAGVWQDVFDPDVPVMGSKNGGKAEKHTLGSLYADKRPVTDRLFEAISIEAASDPARKFRLLALSARYAATHGSTSFGGMVSGSRVESKRPIFSSLYSEAASRARDMANDLPYYGEVGQFKSRSASDSTWREAISSMFYFARRSVNRDAGAYDMATNTWSQLIDSAPPAIALQAVERAANVTRKLPAAGHLAALLPQKLAEVRGEAPANR